MGTPDFAEKSLRRLYVDGHDVAAVFTQPDKPKSRGLHLTMSPVKELALSRGTPVFQPATLRDGEALESLRLLRPELIAVVAYGRLLPPEILNLPPLGCVNIHGSLLPKYRGAAPVQHAVLNGEAETGVTSQYMVPRMDAGDIIMVKKTAVGPDETAGELYDRLGGLGAELLGETLHAIEAGSAGRVCQNELEATCAPPLHKDMSPIDWTGSAQKIVNQVRGLNPWPVATTDLDGVTVRVFRAAVSGRRSVRVPGEIVSAGPDGIEIACSDGSVFIRELQAPGGRRMPAADYLRGHPICR